MLITWGSGQLGLHGNTSELNVYFSTASKMLRPYVAFVQLTTDNASCRALLILLTDAFMTECT